MHARSPTEQRHTSFIENAPSLPVVIRADESRRTKRSDRVNRDPNGGSGRAGSDRSGLYFEFIRLIDDNGEWLFGVAAAICALMSTRPN
jgi:hypothetical protein